MLLGRNYPIGPNHPVDLLQAMVIEVVARATYSRGERTEGASRRGQNKLVESDLVLTIGLGPGLNWHG